jgi:enoyl-CoA hydratase/carnithine racemase
MSDRVTYRVDGAISTITLNLPDSRNPISDDRTILALLTALDTANRDETVRAIVLTGAGSAFCAGGDLRQLAAPGGLGSGDPVSTKAAYIDGIQRLPLAFEALEVPVIAAVNGSAIGAGCDLACMCDVRIASESARFAVSFVKLGLIPGDGGAWLMPRIVGFAKATELALTGEAIDAQDALACGLVSKVVPDSDLLVEARKFAERIAANPRGAVRATKRLLRQAWGSRLDATLEYSAAMQAIMHTTSDHKLALTSAARRLGALSERTNA